MSVRFRRGGFWSSGPGEAYSQQVFTACACLFEDYLDVKTLVESSAEGFGIGEWVF